MLVRADGIAVLGVALWMLVRAAQIQRGGPAGPEFHWSDDEEGDGDRRRVGMVVLFVIGSGVVALSGGGLVFTLYLLRRKLRGSGS